MHFLDLREISSQFISIILNLNKKTQNEPKIVTFQFVFELIESYIFMHRWTTEALVYNTVQTHEIDWIKNELITNKLAEIDE